MQKRYLIAAVARNLGLLMRKLFAIGTPKGLQAAGGLVSSACLAQIHVIGELRRLCIDPRSPRTIFQIYATAACAEGSEALPDCRRARNLGLIICKVFAIATPRGLQAAGGSCFFCLFCPASRNDPILQTHRFPDLCDRRLNQNKTAIMALFNGLLEPLATAWPWLGVLAVSASTLEIIAVAIFIAVIVATLRGAEKRLEFYDYYILAALGWFLLHAIYESVYLAATLLAPDRDHLLQLIATWQAPLREIQIHGFAMMMILGASQRIFHYFYGLPAPNPRRSLAALFVLNLAIVGNVVGFMLMRLVGHAWAALWYGSILVMATTVVSLVAGWHIYSPARDIDRSLKYLRTAYVWLFISLTMLVFLPVYQFGILARFAPESAAAGIGFSHAYYGAIRHAVTVGFISLMIMGVSAKVVPTLAGIDVHKLNRLWLPLVLLNIGCALRVITQILTDYTPAAFPISGISGLLELTALAIWGVHLWRLMFAPRRGRKLPPGPDPGSTRPEPIRAADHCRSTRGRRTRPESRSVGDFRFLRLLATEESADEGYRCTNNHNPSRLCHPRRGSGAAPGSTQRCVARVAHKSNQPRHSRVDCRRNQMAAIIRAISKECIIG